MTTINQTHKMVQSAPEIDLSQLERLFYYFNKKNYIYLYFKFTS